MEGPGEDQQTEDSPSTPEEVKAEPRPPCQTLVFFDIETSGLSEADQITELSLVAVHREELYRWPDKRPRVLNKLCVCLYPMRSIPFQVENLTGLGNWNLEKQSPFNSDLVLLLRIFLLRLDPPVVLIAHNGHRFDFPHLCREISHSGGSLSSDLLCADSLPLLRAFEPPSDARPSFRLAEVFRRRTGAWPASVHGAEPDCLTLMALLQMAGEEGAKWIDEHATPLSEWMGERKEGSPAS